MRAYRIYTKDGYQKLKDVKTFITIINFVVCCLVLGSCVMRCRAVCRKFGADRSLLSQLLAQAIPFSCQFDKSYLFCRAVQLFWYCRVSANFSLSIPLICLPN